MHGLKSAILAIFQQGLGGCALLMRRPHKHITAFEKLFLILGANEYLERLEGKVRKCLFFHVKIF
jgi:hypothetical protein